MTRMYPRVLAVALLALAFFTGPSFAEGEYYEGLSRDKATTAASQTDHNSTASVGHQQSLEDDRQRTESGDFYEGTMRSN